LLAGYQFVGTNRWADATNGTILREIVDLPQSGELGRYLVERLAQTPRTLFPADLKDTQVAAGIPLLQPLLEDLLRHESFLEVRRAAGGEPVWLFGIALPPDRGSLWHQNLTELQTLWGFGTSATAEKEGVSVTTVRHAANGTVLRWVRHGGWLLLELGADPSKRWDEALAAVRQSRRPCPELSGGWLSAELDLPHLASVLGLSKRLVWPRIALTASGREQDVRLVGRLVFPEPVTGPLEPWQVPTNLIREPLIGFSAWRGVRPWLERWEFLSRLGITPAPNEVYCWAQSVNVPQSLVAFPANDATNRVRAMLEPGLELIPSNWRERGLGQLEWREQDNQLVWKSLPLLFPHVRPFEDAGRGYIMGGTFPALLTTNAPPRGLLDQLKSKPDLVYYHWEMTTRRLAQFRMQIQLGTMLTGKAVLRNEPRILQWLDEMERRLGNCATELVAVSPTEWSMTRRSPIGLTAVELVGLLCWTESLDFPRFNLRFPDQTSPKAPQVPPKKPVPVPQQKK
jgi:hypothetical protein